MSMCFMWKVNRHLTGDCSEAIMGFVRCHKHAGLDATEHLPPLFKDGKMLPRNVCDRELDDLARCVANSMHGIKGFDGCNKEFKAVVDLPLGVHEETAAKASAKVIGSAWACAYRQVSGL